MTHETKCDEELKLQRSFLRQCRRGRRPRAPPQPMRSFENMRSASARGYQCIVRSRVHATLPREVLQQ